MSALPDTEVKAIFNKVMKLEKCVKSSGDKLTKGQCKK